MLVIFVILFTIFCVVVIKPQLISKGYLLFELIHAPFVYTHFLSLPTSFVIIIKLLCPCMGPFY
jgi:hypothetical protein